MRIPAQCSACLVENKGPGAEFALAKHERAFLYYLQQCTHTFINMHYTHIYIHTTAMFFTYRYIVEMAQRSDLKVAPWWFVRHVRSILICVNCCCRCYCWCCHRRVWGRGLYLFCEQHRGCSINVETLGHGKFSHFIVVVLFGLMNTASYIMSNPTHLQYIWFDLLLLRSTRMLHF